MSLALARSILDRARCGEWFSVRTITVALRRTGDIPTGR